MASTVSGTWPVEAPTPRLSKAMTWRFFAMGSMMRGSQLSSRRGQVDEEDHRDAALRAEFTVRVGDAAGGDGTRRGLGVRGDDTFVRGVVGPHDGCSFRVLTVVRRAVLDPEAALFFLRHGFLLP